MESTCSGGEAIAATSFLNTVAAYARNGVASGTIGDEQVQCVEVEVVPQPNASSINQLLYCGFHQACSYPAIAVICAGLQVSTRVPTCGRLGCAMS